MKKMFWAAQAAFFYLFTWFFALIPSKWTGSFGRSVGKAMSVLLSGRRLVAAENISRAMPYIVQQQQCQKGSTPSVQGLVSEVFGNIGSALVEVCRLYHGRGSDIFKRIDLKGREHYEAAHARKKGLIFLSGHCGNWELMALAFPGIFNFSMSVVARRQNNPYLNDMVEKMRMRYCNQVIYKENALKNIISVIRQNGVVGLLVDQAVMPEEGCLISFLGRKAWASKAPVLLARKTGVPVVPAFIHRDGDRHIIEIYPEIVFSGDNSEAGLIQDIQTYSSAIEKFIVEHPTDWYWVHRRWKRTDGL